MRSTTPTKAALAACALALGCASSAPPRPPTERERPSAAPVVSAPLPSASAEAEAPVGEAPSPAPVPAPAAAPAPAQAASEAPAACAPGDQVVPRGSSDFSWVPRVTGEMLRGASRPRIACFFGDESGTNGSFVALRPHAPDRFASALVDGSNPQRPRASVQLGFPPSSLPLVADITRAIKGAGAAKSFPHHHPIERGKTTVIHLKSPADTSLRVLIEHARDDDGRAVGLTLDWDDLRGWAPDRSCDDHVAIVVDRPAGQPRLPAGLYEVTARAGAQSFSARCEVPASLLDEAGCRPRAQHDLVAVVEAVSSRLELRLFGRHARVEVEVTRDGAPFARRAFAPKYPSGFPCTIARETVVP